MASKVATAIRRENAAQRINGAAFLISQRLNAPALVFPLNGKDVDILRAQQFEALAEWLEAVATAPVKENKNGTKAPRRKKRIHPQPHRNQ